MKRFSFKTNNTKQPNPDYVPPASVKQRRIIAADYASDLDRNGQRKAILVIDMPDSCWNCSLIVEKENGCKVCPITNCTLISRDGKFPWCPLKPVPEKHQECEVNDYWVGFDSGYNACIDKIVGE